MIFGDKNSFGIECEIISLNRGYVRLWVNKYPIGLYEEVYLLPIVKSLERVADYSFIEEMAVSSFDPLKVARFILKHEDNVSKTLIGLGESFDCFDVRAYKHQSNVVFIWSINRKVIPEELRGIYKNDIGVYGGNVNIEKFQTVLSLYKENVSKP